MITKKQQLQHNKTKKPSMRNKPKITEHERDYLQWLQTQSFSCFICGTLENIEYHHIKLKSTDKKVHSKVIALCVQHHRLSNVLSPHNAPKNWRSTVSMEEQEKYAKTMYELFLKETT